MTLYGVGIDAEENLIEPFHITLLRIAVQLMHVTYERLFLFCRVFGRIDLIAIEDVVRDVIIGVKTVSGADALVDESCHALVEVTGREVRECLQVSKLHGLAYLEMYITLPLRYPREDTVEVLSRLLDIRSELSLIEFHGLEQVARFPLV